MEFSLCSLCSLCFFLLFLSCGYTLCSGILSSLGISFSLVGCLFISEIPGNTSFQERTILFHRLPTAIVSRRSRSRLKSIARTLNVAQCLLQCFRVSQKGLHPAAESQRQGCRSSCGGRGRVPTERKQELITCLRRLSTSGVKQISLNIIYIPYFKTFYVSPCCCWHNAGCRSGFEGRYRSRIFKHSLVMTLLISVFFGESVRGMGFQGSDSESSNWTTDFPTR
jgi:hypothetical protein